MKKILFPALAILSFAIAIVFVKYSAQNLTINEVSNSTQTTSPIANPPSGCTYQPVQCSQPPCEPVLVCDNNKNTPTNTLSFNPNSIDITSPNSTPHTTQLVLKTSTQPTAATIKLSFSPDITITKITPTSVMSEVLSTPQITANQAEFSFGVKPDYYNQAQPTQTNIPIANITFTTSNNQTNNSQPLAISINSSSIVTALNQTVNILDQNSSSFVVTINLPSPKPSVLGDLNQDGIVNLFDYNIFITEYGKTNSSPADLNQDGLVDIFDYNLFVANYGKGGATAKTTTTSSSVATPTTSSPNPTSSCPAFPGCTAINNGTVLYSCWQDQIDKCAK